MKHIICPVDINDEYIARIESKGGRSTLESWIGTAQTLEKLQLDRVFELRNGAGWKVKNSNLIRKDRACVTLTNRLRSKKISIDDYVDKVINIMGDFRK